MNPLLQNKIQSLFNKCPDLFKFWESYNLLYKQHCDLTLQNKQLKQQLLKANEKMTQFHQRINILQSNKNHYNPSKQLMLLNNQIIRLRDKNGEYQKIIENLRKQCDIQNLINNEKIRKLVQQLTQIKTKNRKKTIFNPVENKQTNQIRSISPSIFKPVENKQSNQIRSISHSIFKPVENKQSNQMRSFSTNIFKSVENKQSNQMRSISPTIFKPVENKQSNQMRSFSTNIFKPVENKQSNQMRSFSPIIGHVFNFKKQTQTPQYFNTSQFQQNIPNTNSILAQSIYNYRQNQSYSQLPCYITCQPCPPCPP